MKNVQNYFFGAAFIVLFSLSSKSCNNPNISSDCIDRSKITKGMCPADFDPVCGCDGKTYSNECEAGRAGVIKWTKGACPK